MKYGFTTKSSHDIKKIIFLKQNPYCTIYCGEVDNKPVIIKNYREDSAHLVSNEAQAITTYHNVVKENSHWTDCSVIESVPEKNFLIVSFVSGCGLSKYIYKSYLGNYPTTSLLNHIQSLGVLLRKIYLATYTKGEIDPFFMKYGTYCLEKLQTIPNWKKIFPLPRFTQSIYKNSVFCSR